MFKIKYVREVLFCNVVVDILLKRENSNKRFYLKDKLYKRKKEKAEKRLKIRFAE